MKRIAIIGANGQVGSEVCLFLRELGGVEVVPICRTEIGSAFLRQCGFTPRHGDVSRPDQAPGLLRDVDLVADFSLPSGSSVEVRRAIHGVVTTAVASSPAGVPYVYLSSITAFGIPDFRSRLGWYRLSRNQYGASKRFGERLVRRTARTSGRPAFVLRVGVVHGELQAVSRQVEHDLRRSAGETAYVPDAPSFTVFAFSIAEALANIAAGKERPGTYTMLSNPAWRWRDLHEHFAARTGVESPVVLLPPDPHHDAGLLRRLTGAAWRLVAPQKELVGAYLTTTFPGLEPVVRARYHTRNAVKEIAAGGSRHQYRPYGNNHSEFPGSRLSSLSDSRRTMEPVAARVRAVLDEVVHAAKTDGRP